MDIFYEFYAKLEEQEGNYSNVKGDPGGRTIYGVSEKYFPNDFALIYNAYLAGNIKEAKATAKYFFHKTFWNPRYALLPKKVGFLLFSIGVNKGVETTVKIFQVTLNEYFGENLVMDGKLGDLTQSAALRVESKSLFSAFAYRLMRHYHIVTEADPEKKKFILGWMNRVLWDCFC